MELTKEQFKIEFKRIEENKYTLEEYIKASRVGMDFQLNRKMRKEVYSSYKYNKEIELLYNSQTHHLDNINKGLSQNGMIAYNAICKHRDEVMYLEA